MTYLVLYILHFFVPGWLLTSIIGRRRHRYLIALSVSYALLVANLAVLRLLAVPTAVYPLVFGSELAVLVGIWWWRTRFEAGRPTRPNCAAVRTALLKGLDAGRGAVSLGALAVALLTGLYLAYARPYTEVPSDAYWHLAQFQNYLRALADGETLAARGLSDLGKGGGYWYLIHAYLSWLAGTDIRGSIVPLTYANTMALLLAVYFFGLWVFARHRIGTRAKVAIAILAAGLFAASTGYSVFAYVRYYVFAPTLLNYALFLAAVAVAVDYLVNPRAHWAAIVIVALLVATMAVVHDQEALLAAAVISLVVLVLFVRQWRSGWSAGTSRRIGIAFGAGVVTLVVLSAVAYAVLNRSATATPALVALHDYFGWLPKLFILNPQRQFYPAVMAWGLLVYVLYALRYRSFRNNAYIRAGMLLPLATVFNPWFVDLFLRYSYAELLWRLSYALPLPYVGAYLLYDAASALRDMKGIGVKLAAASTGAVLVAALFPLDSRYLSLPHSRLYTLRRIPDANRETHWIGLLRFLDELQERRQIITDPVTGYVVKGMTRHRYDGYKFYKLDARPYNFNSYDDKTFAAYAGWLLVINRRDGGLSPHGQLSTHWRGQVLLVNQYYSPLLDQHVENHPQLFHKLWEADGVRVYEIQRAADDRREG